MPGSRTEMRIVKCKIVNEELAMWTVLILQNTTVPKCGVTRSAFGGDRDYRPVGKVILHIKTTFYEYIIFVPRKRMKQVTSAQINKIKLLLYILHTVSISPELVFHIKSGLIVE